MTEHPINAKLSVILLMSFSINLLLNILCNDIAFPSTIVNIHICSLLLKSDDISLSSENGDSL